MLRHKIEILLPKRYNNNKPIEGKKFRETFQEIFEQFGGCTQDNAPLYGEWKDPKTNKKYKDITICYWVICNDSLDTVYFMELLKQRLIDRFKQKEMMIYYTIINHY